MFIRSPPLTLFPIYLLPSIPFRRRKPSTDSTTSTDSADTTASATSNAPQEPYLTGHTSHLRCAKCSTALCLTSQIISKGFTGRHGRAYLVSPTPSPATYLGLGSPTNLNRSTPSLPNTKTDAPSSRQLVTGIHTVADVRCAICASMLGWKYEGAEEESQRYKVGKYILETKMVVGVSNWEVGEWERELPPLMVDGCVGGGEDGGVEFDSQDEEECEDLFAGVWSRELAGRRRERRAFRGPKGEGMGEM
ncbi:hypothetical protein N7G274_007514 [Stereocaulon virgatum]|uniref:Yippee domain-containing protein n=1 Tax=Stereocaulon virgatum TaxID=373712 RepID=A0ABR4A2I2_9LECA